MDKKIANIVSHADVSEKAIEAYLVQEVKKLGGVCLKYSNPGVVGYPDRVALLPGGYTVWVELKSKGRKPTKVQRLRIGQLTEMGHSVAVLDSRDAVNSCLRAVGFLRDLENDL